MAKGIDTGNHPKRKVGREDYHTTTVAAAGDFARNNPAPGETEANVRSIMGNFSNYSPSEQRWALQESGDYDRD